MHSVNLKSKPVLNLIKPFLRLKATTATANVQYKDALPKIPGPSFLQLVVNHLPRGNIYLVVVLIIIVFKMLLFNENTIIWKWSIFIRN